MPMEIGSVPSEVGGLVKVGPMKDSMARPSSTLQYNL